MAVRRVPPVPSPVLLEVFELLARRGFQIEDGIAEEVVTRPDFLRVEHDLYVLKSHTELSLSLAGILHAQGARLLNPYLSCIAAQNKIVAAQRLRALGVPVPPCWVTGDLRRLRPMVEVRPLIIKPYLGHRGAGIHVVRTPEELAAVPPPPYPVLVQEFVEGTGEDLKVYVIGDEVFATRKPFSADSFSRPGRPCPVDPEVRQVARRCGEALGLGLYGIDIVEGRQGLSVVDVNYFPGYKGVANAAPLIAAYIEAYAREQIRLPPPPPAFPPGSTVRLREVADVDEAAPS